MLYKALIHCTVIKSSCTRVTRWNASVIKVGEAYVNIRISTRLKEELTRVIAKWLWVISNKMLVVLPRN